MTNKISRAQWDQITKRVKMTEFTFDPKWKCLIDGLSWRRCYDHSEDDQYEIIAQVKKRISA